MNTDQLTLNNHERGKTNFEDDESEPKNQDPLVLIESREHERKLHAAVLADLNAKFDPLTNREDTAILFEITGYKQADSVTDHEARPSLNSEILENKNSKPHLPATLIRI